MFFYFSCYWDWFWRGGYELIPGCMSKVCIILSTCDTVTYLMWNFCFFVCFWFFACRNLYCSFYALKEGWKETMYWLCKKKEKKKKRLRICFVVSSPSILPMFSAEWFLPQQHNNYILLSLSFGKKTFLSANEEFERSKLVVSLH